MFGLSKIELAIIGGLLAVVLTAGGITYVFHKGENAGSSSVTSAVQEKTIQTLGAARADKEKANEAVRNAPLDRVIDGLR